MTTPSVPPPGCPAHGSGQRIPLDSAEFAANPHAYYRYMRELGPTAPVTIAPGVEATLVTDYNAALELLQDSTTFRKDSRRWRALAEGRIRPDSPVLPLLGYRPNAMFTDGAEHVRLRQAITDSFARVSNKRLSRIVGQAAQFLINQFSSRGSADLLRDYAQQLPLYVFNELFGCPAEIGDRVLFGISGMFDGVNAEAASQVLLGAVSELVALKRARPGEDITSYLMQHPAQLDDEELAHTLVLLLGAGGEPEGNLIGNAFYTMLTNEEFARLGQFDKAVDDTLWRNAPMSNYAPHYPVVDTEVAGDKVRAGDLVLVSFGAANTALADRGADTRGHLAWSAGPHACPSKEPARLIALTGLETLFNALPDVELAVPADSLAWRPGPFNRALASLPVRFSSVTPRAAAAPEPTSVPRYQAPPVAAAPASAAPQPTGKAGRWSSFMKWLTSQ
ncbi:cytochrome P450 [Streptomyces sp. DT20]|uniref:cytochrome P450 n=1 Tax=unclassified Streptomyces TaxID=2593676 RepID=UPI00093AE095|nr:MULTISPECIES: cytochrome P450 [unclassified Streptomyces]OKK14504.1 cytochrome [Streptomyces sp. CB02488]WRZ14755.1 cytochrome P450 [Streptomyces sp. NBC_00341]